MKCVNRLPKHVWISFKVVCPSREWDSTNKRLPLKNEYIAYFKNKYTRIVFPSIFSHYTWGFFGVFISFQSKLTKITSTLYSERPVYFILLIWFISFSFFSPLIKTIRLVGTKELLPLSCFTSLSTVNGSSHQAGGLPNNLFAYFLINFSIRNI